MPDHIYVNKNVSILSRATTFLQHGLKNLYESLLNYYSPIYVQPIPVTQPARKYKRAVIKITKHPLYDKWALYLLQRIFLTWAAYSTTKLTFFWRGFSTLSSWFHKRQGQVCVVPVCKLSCRSLLGPGLFRATHMSAHTLFTIWIELTQTDITQSLTMCNG
jgi:hypothetical protein